MTKRLGYSASHKTVYMTVHAGSDLKARIESLEACVSRLNQELANANGGWQEVNLDLQDAGIPCQTAAEPCEYLGSMRLTCFKSEIICCSVRGYVSPLATCNEVHLHVGLGSWIDSVFVLSPVNCTISTPLQHTIQLHSST